MRTFDDPLADGEETWQVLRALAHVTRSFHHPGAHVRLIVVLAGSDSSVLAPP